jgi:predicted Holliday junction resolvase-like endonuclease
MIENIKVDWLLAAFVIIILYAFERYHRKEIRELEKYYRKEIRERDDDIYEMKEIHATNIENARKNTIKSSQSTIKGQISEILAPWLMTSVNSVKELNFLGNPIDFIGFKGLDNNEEVEIKFIEVKTDTSSLSTKQRMIRDAVKAKRVEWEEVRIKTNENLVVDYK